MKSNHRFPLAACSLSLSPSVSFSSPPTSLALSPTGEFLATSHAGRLGISLWCDKSYFRMVHLDGSPDRPSDMNEPCPVAECEDAEADDGGFAAPLLPSAMSGPAESDGAEGEGDGRPPEAKDVGLVTLSGLPPAHWKNLFRLELVRERNRPSEAPAKPAQAPFFLQWRGNPDSSSGADAEAGAEGQPGTKQGEGDDGWDAAWSDDESDGETDGGPAKDAGEGASKAEGGKTEQPAKRRKVAIHRSKLADLLLSCRDGPAPSDDSGLRYSPVTSYLSTMGPSSIDVEVSSLCHGPHDLDDGLPLLLSASRWLLEACGTGTSFEAVNAYLHRFLRVHGGVVVQMGQRGEGDDAEGEAGGEEERDGVKELLASIELLRREQQSASDRLQGKMQHTICLLRHLSRMV